MPPELVTPQEIEARIIRVKYPVQTKQKNQSTQANGSTSISEADCQRLTALAERFAKKKRLPWQDHRWDFPTGKISYTKIHRTQSIQKY